MSLGGSPHGAGASLVGRGISLLLFCPECSLLCILLSCCVQMPFIVADFKSLQRIISKWVFVPSEMRRFYYIVHLC